ncbi:hypothetical protein HYPSUDRAFT_135875 [Hypholoma sublateritium FD-334 SS-4]|uniref:Uncharacterized protein n=1 Tax=Hypholoma sublateritium (strain FD-334 SS-4) TaxID=945553 RepID=A0A0D2PYS4_HYPSF|nr:hypothetical protein HYPSUDRAFT_135875 [Hypholoma sublateritium FD-334 SS-4]
MSNDEDKAIRLTIPRRVLVVPATAFVVGTAIGIMRGGRAASLRFLAENAHRPPTTVQGWYFYKKTKNYRVMLGALKGAGAEAGKLTGLGLAYVGIEEGLVRAGWAPAKDVGAAVGTALVFSTVYRLPVVMARRTVVLALAVGGAMTGLERVAGLRP